MKYRSVFVSHNSSGRTAARQHRNFFCARSRCIGQLRHERERHQQVRLHQGLLGKRFFERSMKLFIQCGLQGGHVRSLGTNRVLLIEVVAAGRKLLRIFVKRHQYSTGRGVRPVSSRADAGGKQAQKTCGFLRIKEDKSHAF